MIWIHSFSMYAKFSVKLTIAIPTYAHAMNDWCLVFVSFLDARSVGPSKYPLSVSPFLRLSIFLGIFSQERLIEIFGFFTWN